MAMIGRGSAIAAMGKRRREVHGPVAFAAWLGVHLLLMTGARARMRALVDWIFVNVSRTVAPRCSTARGLRRSTGATTARPSPPPPPTSR